MKISFNQTSGPNVRDTNGYGYAAKMCKESLTTLGHEISWRDPSADIEINFIQPDKWYWSGVDYRIAYLPWESTLLHSGWVEKLNQVDEVWTPSPIIADWFRAAGVTKDVKVYQHGVDDVWEPIKRSLSEDERFRIIHTGAEALRKGGNDTIQAFMRTLWDEPATLVLKMVLQAWNMHDTDHIHIHKTKVPIEELVALYHSCHAMVYPSWGEGFGLTPLQAMATGMPVLITKGWAPYEYLLPEEMLIESTLEESPWPHIHPGKMFKPEQGDLDSKMKALYENCDKWFDYSFDLVPRVREDYNWLTLTEKAFSHLT